MRVRRLCVVALSLSATAGLLAQNQSELPQFRAGVELVQLDVAVLDDKRQPVRGLTAADFTVLDAHGTACRIWRRGSSGPTGAGNVDRSVSGDGPSGAKDLLLRCHGDVTTEGDLNLSAFRTGDDVRATQALAADLEGGPLAGDAARAAAPDVRRGSAAEPRDRRDPHWSARWAAGRALGGAAAQSGRV